MEIKIKKLSDKGVIPTCAKHGDAGMDLTATSKYLFTFLTKVLFIFV